MDSKLEVLLVEDDVEVCEEISNQILDSEDMVLVGVTNNAQKAIQEIIDKLPDAVILDLELHTGSGNGLSVLQELSNISIPKRPYILITTNNSSRTTYELAHSLGADFIMSKHKEGYSIEGVLDFLRITKAVIRQVNNLEMLGVNTTETEEQRIRRITRRIMVELDRVGINPKSVGYAYLVDAIMIVIKNAKPTKSNEFTNLKQYHIEKISSTILNERVCLMLNIGLGQAKIKIWRDWYETLETIQSSTRSNSRCDNARANVNRGICGKHRSG